MSKEVHAQNTTDNHGASFRKQLLIPASVLPERAFPLVNIPDHRYNSLVLHGTKRAKNAPGTIEHHILGILGEFAAAKFFGVPEKVDTEIYEHGDPGYDFEVGGWRVDVKTARPEQQRPSLIVGTAQELKADFYLLAHELAATRYQIIGYTPRAVVEHAPVRTFRLRGMNRIREVEQGCIVPLTEAFHGVFG